MKETRRLTAAMPYDATVLGWHYYALDKPLAVNAGDELVIEQTGDGVPEFTLTKN